MSGRRSWQTRGDLLGGGAEVRALAYQRASRDRRKTEKSVTDQERLNLREIASHGWGMRSGDSFTDNDRSSSRHARRGRPDFERLNDEIRSGHGDVLVMWELARGQRDLGVYVSIRDLCVEVGLNFWLVGGVLYDLRDKNDRMSLGMQAVQAEFQADYIRDGAMRGMAGAAEDGRPHGKLTYGYRRVYSPATGAFVSQELDFVPREGVRPVRAGWQKRGPEEAAGAGPVVGSVVTYSAADVVREIFDCVASGRAMGALADSLNDRGIPSPQGKEWRRTSLRVIALNPAYIGKRVFQGAVVGEGQWPPLVDEDTYWTCVRILRDPGRRTSRSSRAVHLLSHIAVCGVCGSPLRGYVHRDKRRGGRERFMYLCARRSCVSIEEDRLDEFVERTIVRWLSRADVYESFAEADDNAEAVVEARAEGQRLRAELEEYKRLAEAGDVTPITLARMEKSLLARIGDAESRAAELETPAVLRGRVGPGAAAAWAALEDDGGLTVKRDIIKTVADLRLMPVGPGAYRSLGNPDHLQWTWKLGGAPG